MKTRDIKPQGKGEAKIFLRIILHEVSRWVMPDAEIRAWIQAG